MARKIRLLAICLMVGLFFFSIGGVKVSAAEASHDYYLCLAQSNASNVDNVQKTCEVWAYNPGGSNNICSLWIGQNSENSVTVNTYKTEGTVDIFMYGMCTGDPHPADNIRYLSGDNGSISLPPSGWNNYGDYTPTIERGPWGAPRASAVSLDIAKFIEGINGTRQGNYMAYRRTIITYRCYQNSSYMGGTTGYHEPYPANLDDFCGPSTSDVILRIYDPPIVDRKLTLIYSANPSADFPGGNTWTQNDSLLKKVINYNSDGFTNGMQLLHIKSGIDPYQSATAPATITNNGATYKINRVLATDYKDGVTNCDSESVKFVHMQNDSFTNGNGGTTNGCQNIYVVYEMQKRTLTARARPDSSHYFKPDGTIVGDTNGIWTNSSSVDSGGTATVSSSSFNPDGYSWNRWDSEGACSGAGADRNCSVSNLTSDTIVDAYYVRNSFKARARASKGSSWEGDNSIDSGFVESGSAGTSHVSCDNDSGCTVGFWFDLKSVAGSGPTVYSIQKRSDQKNGKGEWDWSNLSDYTNKSFTPNSSSAGSNVYAKSENLAVGSIVCYRIEYRPYGINSNTTTKTVSACAEIVPAAFVGKTEVTGEASAVSGWTDASNPKSISKVTSIENCSPVNGCKVTFSHYLKRYSGITSTAYSVKRSSNLIVSPKAISSGTIVSNTSFGSNNETLVSKSENLALYPGMVVCEWLTFKPNNLPGTTGTIHTKACVHAHGNAQPEGSGDDALLNIKVKNPSAATKYNNYQKEIYAKPGDVLTYRAAYNPILQYTYYLIPQEYRIDNGAIYENTESTLGTLFDAHLTSGLYAWNNAFSVQKGINNASYNLITGGNHKYDKGDTTKRQETNDYTVNASDVGKSIDEKAITNLNSTVKTTPSQVTFSDDGGKNLGRVITAPINDIAYARIPYNFINTTRITNDDSIDIYAGESAAIKYDYIVGVKPNAETSPNKNYATKVDSPKWKLSIKIGNNDWVDTPESTASSISVSSMYEGVVSSKTTTINIPDVPAGTEVCIIPMIYPSNSGADTNYSDKKGSDKWVRDVSTQKCYKVAKKPNMEVWGGNVYSRGAISTAVAAKSNLEGYTSYSITGSNNSNKRIFGSWVESGLISNGVVRGLASGAGTGFATNNNGALTPAYTFGNSYNGPGNNSPRAQFPGGSEESTQNFCLRSTLTFANANCNGTNGTAGNLNSVATNNNVNNDKTAILRKFISTSYGENTSGNVVLNDSNKIMENGVYYYYGKNSLNIPEANINKGTIQVVYSDQNITITGNLVYANSESYATLEEIPKLIIYAKNVTISCEVSRVDALIVADSEVKTCDSDDINSRRNSNQLKVNGAIITNSIVPNRTYGAATGANSIIPAEIINFDPSLYLWGGNDRKDDVSANDMNVNYIHEMAPRY